MKITYGLKKLAYALITEDENGAITYSKPVNIPGARAISLSPVGEDTPVYADDIKYVTITSNQGYEGDMTVLGIPDSFAQEAMGMTLDANGVLLESAEDSKKNFALLGEFSSETAEKKRFILYNCVAGRPEFSGNTKEDTVEAAELTIPLTCSPAVDTGAVKATVVGGIEANTAFDNWYTTVYLKAGE